MPAHSGLPAKLRNLDGLEKVFWLYDRHGPTHFCIVAEITGSTTVDGWRKALNHVGRQTPFVGTQILVDEDGNPYFSQPEPRDVPLTVFETASEMWPHQVGLELSAPFEVSKDVLVRARLLVGDEQCALILTFHHSISDGSSAAFFMRNVIEALGGLKVSPSADTTSLEELVERKEWPPMEVGPDVDPGLTPPNLAGPRTAPPAVTARCLSVEETEALRERARREGTTVHAALVVAAADAFDALHPGYDPSPPRVFSPIDARRRLFDANDALGVFVSGIVTRVDTGITGFWDAARNITSEFATLVDPRVLASKIGVVRPMAAGVSSPDVAAAMMAQVFGAEVLVTNLAVLDLAERFGNFYLSHLWGPALAFGIQSEQVVGVVTVGGRLHLVHTTHDAAKGMLDFMIDNLAAATSISSR